MPYINAFIKNVSHRIVFPSHLLIQLKSLFIVERELLLLFRLSTYIYDPLINILLTQMMKCSYWRCLIYSYTLLTLYDTEYTPQKNFFCWNGIKSLYLLFRSIDSLDILICLMMALWVPIFIAIFVTISWDCHVYWCHLIYHIILIILWYE